MAVVLTDDFNRTNANPIGAPYTSINNNIQIVNNRAIGTTGSANNEVRYGSFIVAAMKATITLSLRSDLVNPLLMVRQAAGAYTSYQAVLGGEWEYGKNVDSSYTRLGITSGNTPQSGDTIGISAIGTTIALYENGSQILSTTDSAVLSGTWAFGASYWGTADTSICELDDLILEAFEPFFVGAGTEGSAANGNITNLGLPGGTDPHNMKANDVWVMAAHTTDQNSMMASTDWTKIIEGNGGGTTSRLTTWWFRCDGVNTPTVVISHSAGQSPIAGIAAFRNVTTATTPYVVGTLTGSSNQIIQHLGVTPQGDANALILLINGAADDNNRTIPTDYTTAFEDTGAGTNNAFLTTAGNPDGSVALAYAPTSIAATGTIVVSQGAADAWTSVMIALTQAAAAPQAVWNTVPLLLRQLGITV